MEVFALLPPQEPKLGRRTFSAAEDMLSALSEVK